MQSHFKHSGVTGDLQRPPSSSNPAAPAPPTSRRDPAHSAQPTHRRFRHHHHAQRHGVPPPKPVFPHPPAPRPNANPGTRNRHLGAPTPLIHRNSASALSVETPWPLGPKWSLPNEARPAQVRPAQVRLAQIRVAQVRPDQVRPDQLVLPERRPQARLRQRRKRRLEFGA